MLRTDSCSRFGRRQRRHRCSGSTTRSRRRSKWRHTSTCPSCSRRCRPNTHGKRSGGRGGGGRARIEVRGTPGVGLTPRWWLVVRLARTLAISCDLFATDAGKSEAQRHLGRLFRALFLTQTALCPHGDLKFYAPVISAKVLPKRAGEAATLMPAASMAAILLSASPEPPEIVAQAPAGRCGATGDAPLHGRFPAAFGFVGDKLSAVFLGRATNLTNHDDPLGRFVGQEHRQHVDDLGALDRVPADSHGGRLTEP